MKKKYTLNVNDENFENVMNDIYEKWDRKGKEREEAREILKKMYLGIFNRLNKTKNKRLLLYNLICIEIEIDDVTNSGKIWTKALIDFLNNEPEYVAINLEEYAKAMNNYLYTHKGELSDEELELAYENYYKTFEKYEYEDGSKCFMEKLIAKFNLNMIRLNFTEAFDALKGLLIHNNDTDYMTAFEYCANELKDANVSLYNQILLLSKDNIIKAC